MNKILVTGAAGFIGRALYQRLRSSGVQVTGVVRTMREGGPAGLVATGDLATNVDWNALLENVDGIVHAAGRAHILHKSDRDSLSEFRRANVYATEMLARAAAANRVKRFVYLSSIAVNGDISGQPFTAEDAPNPYDAYSLSKWEAEQALWRIAGETGLEVVVVRPPIVYGPQAKGNILRLLRVLESRVPLPLAGIENRRSMIFIQNLVEAITILLEHPRAPGRVWLVADDQQGISTPDLLRRMAAELPVGRVRLFPFPAAALRLAAKLTGKSADLRRLTGTLQVDAGPIQRELGWRPRYSIEEGLRVTGEWYRRAGKH